MAAEIIELFPKKEEKKTQESLSFRMGMVAGKLKLWEQLPLEWKISEEGWKLNEALTTEAELLQQEMQDYIQQIAQPREKSPQGVFKTYDENFIQERAEIFEDRVKRCDAILDKQPDNKGLKMLRGRMRNWLKKYQEYTQLDIDNKELYLDYERIDHSCYKYLELIYEE